MQTIEVRWNSYYNAMDKIRQIISKMSVDNYKIMCAELEIDALKNNEIVFLREYCEVMKPVTNALDIVQGEFQSHIGILLPTIILLKQKLLDLQHNLRYAVPLVKALVAGMEKRFDHLMDRDDLILASVTMPRFKLRWIKEDTKREYAKSLLEKEMEKHMQAANTDENLLEKSMEFDEFFNFTEPVSICKSVKSELTSFLNDDNKMIESLNMYPKIKQLFLKYNSALPSSAPVERLFSMGGQIFTPRRNRLCDDKFEKQLLLRANKSV